MILTRFEADTSDLKLNRHDALELLKNARHFIETNHSEGPRTFSIEITIYARQDTQVTVTSDPQAKGEQE